MSAPENGDYSLMVRGKIAFFLTIARATESVAPTAAKHYFPLMIRRKSDFPRNWYGLKIVGPYGLCMPSFAQENHPPIS
jgi:hypothetical protein